MIRRRIVGLLLVEACALVGALLACVLPELSKVPPAVRIDAATATH